jgi:flavodoxin
VKTVIIYYSFSGNTRLVARLLAKVLGEKSEVELVELKDLDEDGKFINQGRRAFKHIRAKIEEVNFNLSEYDLICLGTPVWAFTTTPAMNTYLEQCSGLENKRIVLFTTSGGIGDKRCLKYMQDILSKKGVTNFSSFSIPANRIKNKDFILTEIQEIMRLSLDSTQDTA